VPKVGGAGASAILRRRPLEGEKFASPIGERRNSPCQPRRSPAGVRALPGMVNTCRYHLAAPNKKPARGGQLFWGRGLSNTTRKALTRHAFGMGAFRTYAQTYAYAGATPAHFLARAMPADTCGSRVGIALHVAGHSPDTVGNVRPTHCPGAGEVRDARDSGVPMHPARLRDCYGLTLRMYGGGVQSRAPSIRNTPARWRIR
jgi:hypothetical protein